MIRDGVLRWAGVGYAAENPQVCFGRRVDDLGTTNSSKWRIGPPRDRSFDSLPPRTWLYTVQQ